MASVGHRDGKVEQGDGKGAREMSTLSQNWMVTSVLSDLQSLGRITCFHAGGICLGAEGKKKGPLYKKPNCESPLVLPCSYDLN